MLFWPSKGVPKSVQVVFNGIAAVKILTLMILRLPILWFQILNTAIVSCTTTTSNGYS